MAIRQNAWMLGAILSLGGGALAADTATTDTTTTTHKSMRAEHARKMLEMPKTEQEFASQLHALNQHEIKASQAVLDKTQSADVKKYAQMIIDDHTAADQQLTQFAQQQKWTLTAMPKAQNNVDAKHMDAEKAHMALLEALPASVIDSAYLSHMVTGHDMAIAKVESAMSQWPNGKLNDMETQLIPKLKDHRVQAYNLLGHVDATQGVGGSGTMPAAHDMNNMH